MSWRRRTPRSALQVPTSSSMSCAPTSSNEDSAVMTVQHDIHRRTPTDLTQVLSVAQDAPHRHDHDHHEHDHHHEDHDHGHDHDHPFEWLEAVRIVLVAIAAAAVWFRVWEPFAAISVIGVVGLLIGGWPILK